MLNAEGGALRKLLPLSRSGIGMDVTSGCQWVSWIHIQDWVAAICHILSSDRLRGPINMVAGHPVAKADFHGTLGVLLSRPTTVRVSAFAVKLILGPMASDILLASQRVQPRQLLRHDYTF